jgi:oligopeptidase B
MSKSRRTLAWPGPASPLTVSHIEAVPDRGHTAVPRAPVVPHVQVVHGETRIDNYHWLKNRSDPEVIAYLETENRYADSVMRHTESLQEHLYREMRGRIQETDLSVPERRDHYLYYRRIESGGQYPVFCRRLIDAEGDEEIILDLNQLAVGHGYFRIGSLEVSPDHGLLAYTVDVSGSEEFTLFIRDLQSGTLLPETILQTSNSPTWANDSRTLFYCSLDGSRRPYRLYRHEVGTSQQDDVLVYIEPDASFYMEISRTRSGDFLFSTSPATPHPKCGLHLPNSRLSLSASSSLGVQG